MVFFLVSHMEESVKKKADAGLMINILFLLRENHDFRCQGVKPAPNCNCIRWIYAVYMLGRCQEVSRRCQGGVKEVSSLGVLV